nr:hypothetical protein CFP56_60411 [Quercus suber]
MKELIHLALEALPPKYDAFCSAIRTRSDVVTLEEMNTLLNAEERSIKKRIKPSMIAKMEKFSARLVAPRMLELMKVTGVLCHVIKTFLVNMYRTRTWCNKQEILVMLMSHAYQFCGFNLLVQSLSHA